MPASAFEEHGALILRSLLAGLSIADAADRHGVAARTVERWLARGHHDPQSVYGPFAAAVDKAFEARRLPSQYELPLDKTELHLVVSRAARKGNVQAMRLMWDLLRADHHELDE